MVRSGVFFEGFEPDFAPFIQCLFFLLFADKDRELGEAQAKIKALKLSERLREKAVEEVNV